jgi:purine-binding chemotaxis protein CheW
MSERDDDNQRNVNTTAILNDLFGTLQSFKRDTPDITADLLRERARQYAAADAPTTVPTANTLTVLVFTIGTDRFGIDVMNVDGVRPLPPTVRVPGTPPFYRGVMNVRGTVITQWDLLAFLGTGKTHDAAELVVVHHGDLILGVPVTHVHGVADIPRGDIRVVEEVRYAVGVYTGDGANTLVLDATELFADERLMGNNRDEG